MKLLHANDAKKSRLFKRLVDGRNSTVIVRFFRKKDCEKKAEACQSCVDPERNIPLLRRDDEGGEKRAKEGREDDESCPYIDFSPVKQMSL